MKKQIIIGLSLLTLGMAQAQEAGQYLHFNVGGGLHNLSYQLQDGTQKGKPGFTVNAAYSYFFTPHWGVQSGLGLQSFSALSTLNLLTKANDIDTQNDAYELRTNYTNWKEKQQTLFLDIPLSVQYRHSFNEKYGLLASAGAKIAMPLSTGYKTTGGSITTTGYYDQWNIELSDLPQHYFTTTTDCYKGNYSLKTSYMALADVGALYKLSEKTDLYVGGYVNYGLNNVLKPDTKLIYQKEGVYNGILASNQTDKVTPISFGLKVGLYWRIAKKKTAFKETVQEIIPVQPQKADTVKTIEPADIVLNVQDDSAKIKEAYEKAKAIASSINLNFAFNSDQPINSETEKIKALSELLKANPDLTLNLVGNTCNIGTREINMEVGLRRAKTAKQMFLDNGVPETQLMAESKAYDEPLVPNNSIANRKKNRRVLITPFIIHNDSIKTESVEKARKTAETIDFNFGFNSDQPLNSNIEKVKALSDFLIANPDYTLYLEGHTCNIGTRAANLIVGLRRANYVKNMFLKKGVTAGQVKTQSLAFDKPLVPNTSLANRKINRRVEAKISK